MMAYVFYWHVTEFSFAQRDKKQHWLPGTYEIGCFLSLSRRIHDIEILPVKVALILFLGLGRRSGRLCADTHTI
jgi:hypothetical protein